MPCDGLLALLWSKFSTAAPIGDRFIDINTLVDAVEDRGVVPYRCDVVRHVLLLLVESGDGCPAPHVLRVRVAGDPGGLQPGCSTRLRTVFL